MNKAVEDDSKDPLMLDKEYTIAPSITNSDTTLDATADAKTASVQRQIDEYVSMIYIVSIASGMLQLLQLPTFYYLMDELKVDPNQYANYRFTVVLPWTIKPVFGFICDSVHPFKYRVKSWLLIFFTVNALVCYSVYYFKPGYTWLVASAALVETFFCWETIIAQGMCIIVVNLHKSIDPSPDKNGEKGKKIFGNLTILKFFVKSIVVFIGGFYVKEIEFGMFYVIIAAGQLITAVYTLIFFTDERKVSFYQSGASICENIRGTAALYREKSMMYPILLMIVIYLCPQTYDPGNFILTKLAGWKGVDLSTNYIIFGTIYSLTMFYFLNRVKAIPFHVQLWLANICLTITNICNFRFLFYKELDFYLMYALNIVLGLAWHFHLDMILIPIVGRLSKSCPKGIESFAVASISALLYLATAISGFFGSYLLKTFEVKQYHYDLFWIPLTCSFAYGIFALFFTPFLGK
jgi:hypothetical protein